MPTHNGIRAALAACSLLVPVSSPLAQENYAQWAHGKYVILKTTPQGANVPQGVRNFPALVRLGAQDSAIFAQARGNGADLRFTKADGVTRLPHQTELWDSAGRSAAVWVLVDTVRGNNHTNLRMRWGKADAADSSSGPSVFRLADGFAGVWHMGESSGDVADATANAITGTNTGTTSVPGAVGRARNFGGTGNLANNNANAATAQSISLGSPASLSLAFNQRVTLEAWVRWTRVMPTAGSSYWRTILMRGGPGSDELHLRIDNGSPRPYRVGSWVGSTDFGAIAPQGASAYGDSAQWVHLVGVFDSIGPGEDAWRLYRNGALISEGPPFETGPAEGEGSWHIGEYYLTSQRRYFAGDIDEVRFSKVPRGAPWIRLSYENQKSVQTLVSLSDTAAPVLSVGGDARRGSPGSGFLVADRVADGFVFRARPEPGARLRVTVTDIRGREVWRGESPADAPLPWRGAPSGTHLVRASLIGSEGRILETSGARVVLLR